MDRMDLNCYNSRLEINLSRIGRNIDKIRAYTGGLGLIPVVKSNAYGYGTAAVANFLVRRCGIRFLAVARLFEACQIQDSGCPDCGILILGPVPAFQIPTIVKRKIEIPLFRVEDAKRLSEEAKKQGLASVKAHIKIETGMNRIGARPGKELSDLLSCIKGLGNIEIDGVFTHFATADQANEGKGNDFTREQFSRFLEGLSQIREAGITVPVLPGIMPITSAAQMKRSQELSGTVFPRRFLALLDRFGSSPEAMMQAGIAYATDQIIDLLANGVKNIHIYSMNKPEVAAKIMSNISEIIKC